MGTNSPRDLQASQGTRARYSTSQPFERAREKERERNSQGRMHVALRAEEIVAMSPGSSVNRSKKGI